MRKPRKTSARCRPLALAESPASFASLFSGARTGSEKSSRPRLRSACAASGRQVCGFTDAAAFAARRVLAERAPCFEALKVVSAWAGYYDYNTFDQNAFIGPVDGVDGLILACGHSGHGIQQAIATGRAVSELVLDGGYATLDLAPFGYGRYARGERMLERNIV
eukprot:COSAG04_NODE_607_length_12104_cov_5.753853_1_plen_164_part_00